MPGKANHVMAEGRAGGELHENDAVSDA